MKDRSFFAGSRCPCLRYDRSTVDSIKSVDGKLDTLMDMFVLLLGGVNLLLFLLLSAIKITSHVDIDSLSEE